MLYRTKYITILLFILISCKTEKPSVDKLRCLEILEAIDSKEVELVGALPNHLINAFYSRPSHDILFSLGTIVHEANHIFHDIDNDKRIRYRIDANYEVVFERLEVFESKQILETMPQDHLDYFMGKGRYELYIADSQGIERMSTQVNGLYGLLDEYNSYYQDIKTIVGLYKYLISEYTCGDSNIWRDYLGLYDSTMNSMMQFRYFTAAYMRHAKIQYRDLCEKFVSNKDLIAMLDYLDKQERILLKDYALIQQEILADCSSHLHFENGSVRVSKSDSGYVINTDSNRSLSYDRLIAELESMDKK